MAYSPTRVDAPGSVSAAPIANAARGDPLVSALCHLGGFLAGLEALPALRSALRRWSHPLRMTSATANAISPNAMSTSGFTVCWTDLVTSEPFSVRTMMRPTVTLVR
jgi:hypothetical protein